MNELVTFTDREGNDFAIDGGVNEVAFTILTDEARSSFITRSQVKTLVMELEYWLSMTSEEGNGK